MKIANAMSTVTAFLLVAPVALAQTSEGTASTTKPQEAAPGSEPQTPGGGTEAQANTENNAEREAPSDQAQALPEPEPQESPSSSPEGEAAGSAVTGAAAGSTIDWSDRGAVPPDEAEAKSPQPPTLADEAEEIPEEPRSIEFHQKHIDLAVGLRIDRTANEGLQPLLDAPVMFEPFVRAGGVFATMNEFAFAALGEFGGSWSSSSARGQQTDLSFMHMTLGAEARYHFHPIAFAHARIMVGAERSGVELEESFDSILSDSAWAFRSDLSVGAALRIAGSKDGGQRAPRLWLFADGGVRLTTSYKLELEGDEEDAPARPEPLALAPYSPSGIMGSLGLMGSF